MNKQPDIVCFGEPLLEFTEVSGAKGESLYKRGFGGDTSNTSIAAARQGASVGYFTALSDDDFGEAFIHLWKAEGVDASRVIRNSEANTGVYYVFPHPEGRNFAYFRAGSAASRVTSKDLPDDYISNAKILHVSGISQAISLNACDAVFQAMAIASENGTTVSYDSNLRLQLWPLSRARAVIHEAMSLCNIAFPSLDDSLVLTGLDEPDKIADFYLSKGASIVVLKMGAKGSLIATRGRRERKPAWVCEPVDSTGAGDTFGGAFLAEYLVHGDPFRAAEYANVAAALTTTGMGAVAPIPNRQRIETLIAESPK
jgi:2-dehydro-3-deoxygluconokinase